MVVYYDTKATLSDSFISKGIRGLLAFFIVSIEEVVKKRNKQPLILISFFYKLVITKMLVIIFNMMVSIFSIYY